MHDMSRLKSENTNSPDQTIQAYLLKPVAEGLGFDHLICTAREVGLTGIYQNIS